MSGFDRSVDSSVGETRQLSFTWKPDSFHTVAPHSPHPWKPKKSPAMADMGTADMGVIRCTSDDNCPEGQVWDAASGEEIGPPYPIC